MRSTRSHEDHDEAATPPQESPRPKRPRLHRAKTPLQGRIAPGRGREQDLSEPLQSDASETPEKETEQEQEEKEEAQETPRRKKARTSRQPAPRPSNALPQVATHLILASEKDTQTFFEMANQPGATLQNIRKLDIYLDTKMLDEYAAYRLVLALRELHRHSDGQNPHRLQTIKLVVNGIFLFTRYSYHLVSPTSSDMVDQNLKKFVAGGLTKDEKARLAFALNSTETLIATALLGIRGVSRILIEGKGRMEGCFAETLKATMIQPPGADILEVDDPELPYSTYPMNGTGDLYSEAYSWAEPRPYPTFSNARAYDFSTLKRRNRWIVDEHSQIHNHFMNRPENDRQLSGSTTTKRSGRNAVPKFDVSYSPVLVANTRKRKQGHEDRLGMSDMVKIRITKPPKKEQTKEQKQEQQKTKQWEDPNIELVEFGWKV